MGAGAHNPKLRVGPAGWAPFPGWSLLWASPGPDDPFFEAVAAWSAQLAAAAPLDEHAMAWLPPATYHVTLADGLNAAHPARVAGRTREWTAQVLAAAAEHRLDLARATGAAEPAWRALAEASSTGLVVRPGRLAVRGFALLLDLHPTSEHQHAFEALADHRATALERLGEVLGLELDTPWQLHVTLAYATERRGSERLSGWVRRGAPADAMPQGAVRLRGARLHAFRSMVDFGGAAAD